MKTPIVQMLLLLLASRALAQSPTQSVSAWHATIRVLDEQRQPIPGANVEIGYYVPAPPNQTEASEKIHGLSDGNGLFAATHADTRSVSLGFSATKKGYYSATAGQELGFEYDPVKWNPNVTLLLKKIVSPVPMYAKRVREGPPVADKAVGYDLQVGDWISPWGKGKSTDIIFRADVSQNKLTVTFPNPGDGIQPFVASDLDRTSAFRSPYQAPETGYESQWTKTRGETADEQARIVQDKSKIYFLRLRTVLDEQGNVKQANYGKIYGDFMDFQYFLNPEVNSRNVEFDPTKNLLKNVGPAEHVRSP